MNQYDFIPIPPEDHQKMRHYIIAGVFAVIVVIFAVCIFGCSDNDIQPTADQKLQGAWSRKWLNLTTRYNFHDGACDAYAIIPGQPVQYYAYAYNMSKDTLKMIDLASGDTSVSVVSFESDSTATLSWIDGVNYFLQKIK